MNRSRCLVFLAVLAASSNAFAGGGGGGGGLTDEEMGALCGYAGYALLAALALYVGYMLIAWATAPCRERHRKAAVWREAMNKLPPKGIVPEPANTAG